MRATGAHAESHVSHFKAPPKKQLGQHFLHDRNVIDKIVLAVNPKPGDALVEIGPGQGAITFPLLRKHGALTVIEFDRDLITPLSEAAHGIGELTIVHKDVLKIDFGKLAGEGRLRLVGNLPYNISTPILFHLLDAVDVIEDQHFMLQKEVIDRMVAAPSTSAYGRLSVMLQWRYAMENVLFVPPQSFDPPPRVDSAIVRMVPHAAPAPIDVKLLSELVQVAFSQRRKLLRHTLGQWLTARDFSGVFDTQRRAEEVPVDQYLALALQVAAD